MCWLNNTVVRHQITRLAFVDDCGIIPNAGASRETHGRRLTGHIFKIKMIAVSFESDIDAPSIRSARQFAGAAFGRQMIAQS
jgi:hypothetical protein